MRAIGYLLGTLAAIFVFVGVFHFVIAVLLYNERGSGSAIVLEFLAAFFSAGLAAVALLWPGKRKRKG